MEGFGQKVYREKELFTAVICFGSLDFTFMAK